MSKLFPEDPIFEIGRCGFDDRDAEDRPLDVLGRKPLGQNLTDLVDRFDQPLVIALDGGWGSGKSHFLKLWAGAHKKELGGKAEVIYFDAFENGDQERVAFDQIQIVTPHREAAIALANAFGVPREFK
jgi:hypothetical protein